MSSVDEVLFSPLDGSDEPWRRDCRRLVEHLNSLQRKSQRPPGAMLLEDLLERFHVHDQTMFWVVDPLDGLCNFEFNGDVYVSDTGYAALNRPDGAPIIEWNLYPHEEYSDCYTFWDEKLAQQYEGNVLRSSP